MPRNSSGVYSLPAGNPVVTGTTISSTWANTTLADLAAAMTDSLSRSGDGAMLAPLLLDDGAIGAPALSWGNETTSGLYRAGAGDFRWSIAGADTLQLNTNGIRISNGAVGTPAFSFLSDTDLGFYRFAADIMGLVAVQLQSGAGTAAAPFYSFTIDPDTGIYRRAANATSFSANGILVADVDALGFRSQNLFRTDSDGTAGAPVFSWTSDPDTGFFRIGANQLGLSLNGVLLWNFQTTGIDTASSVQFRLADGTAATPIYSFGSDPDTGIYRLGANTIGFASGGVSRATMDNNQWNFVDGTPSLPALAFSGAANTGIYRPAASTQVAITCNGTVAAVFGSGGLEFGSTGNSWNLGLLSSASASAGGGAALPGTVAGFWQVNINGTTRKIPYYAT